MRASHGLRLIMKIGVNVVYDLFSDFNECSAPAITAVKSDVECMEVRLLGRAARQPKCT